MTRLCLLLGAFCFCFCWDRLTDFGAKIVNHMYLWDVITHPMPIFFNQTAVEVGAWMSDHTPLFWFSFVSKKGTLGTISQTMITSSNGNFFSRYRPFVMGIRLSPVDSPHKGQWRGTLMLPLICAWTNGWANHQDAGDLRRLPAHYEVTVMRFVSL